MAHEPLSQTLERLATDPEVKCLNDVVARTQGRGIFLVIILLCLPFITPLPIPGVSNVIGLSLFVVALRLFVAAPTSLPRFLGEKPWSAERMERVIRASLRVLRWLERVVKPRRSDWLARIWAVRLHAALLGLMALCLALPLPPIIPFSNSVPAYAIILLSASMMEHDGAMIWFAYAAVVATMMYFGLFAGALVRFFVLHEERIIEFFRDLL